MQTKWRHHWSNLHNRKSSISLKRKKIFQKEKRHSSVFSKAFQISRKYFSCHRHFNTFDFNVLIMSRFVHFVWQLYFSRQLLKFDTSVSLANVRNQIPLFPRKYNTDVYFLLTAGDKWNIKVKYQLKSGRGAILFYSKPKFSFHRWTGTNLIIK